MARWKRPHRQRTAPPEKVVGATIAALRYVRYSTGVRALIIRAGVVMFFASALLALLQPWPITSARNSNCIWLVARMFRSRRKKPLLSLQPCVRWSTEPWRQLAWRILGIAGRNPRERPRLQPRSAMAGFHCSAWLSVICRVQSCVPTASRDESAAPQLPNRSSARKASGIHRSRLLANVARGTLHLQMPLMFRRRCADAQCTRCHDRRLPGSPQIVNHLDKWLRRKTHELTGWQMLLGALLKQGDMLRLHLTGPRSDAFCQIDIEQYLWTAHVPHRYSNTRPIETPRTGLQLAVLAGNRVMKVTRMKTS